MCCYCSTTKSLFKNNIKPNNVLSYLQHIIYKLTRNKICPDVWGPVWRSSLSFLMWNKFVRWFFFCILLEIHPMKGASMHDDDALICEAMLNLWLNYCRKYTTKPLNMIEMIWRAKLSQYCTMNGGALLSKTIRSEGEYNVIETKSRGTKRQTFNKKVS